MTPDEPILVVGATGRLGMETVRLLADSHKRVRAVVRATTEAAKRKGIDALPVETMIADLKDPSSLTPACDGASVVISMATALTSRQSGDSFQTVDDLGQVSLVRAAKEAGVKHFVFASCPPNPIDYDFQRARRTVEAELLASGMSFTILQPAAFMEIWLSPALGFGPLTGRARILGDGDQPVSWVSIHDVARLAVVASEGGRCANQVIPIGGPDALSPLQVIGIFEALGAPKVSLEHVPLAVLNEMFVGASNPIEQALAASMLATAQGQVIGAGLAQEVLPGRLVSVRDFARRALAVK
jgi:uncharacterized protein YbjT (DUF2867 family)